MRRYNSIRKALLYKLHTVKPPARSAYCSVKCFVASETTRPYTHSHARAALLPVRVLARVWLWHHGLWSYRYGNATLGRQLSLLEAGGLEPAPPHQHHVAHLVGQRPQKHEPRCRGRAEAIAQRRGQQSDGGARCAVGRRRQRKSGGFVGDGGWRCLQMSGKCPDSLISAEGPQGRVLVSLYCGWMALLQMNSYKVSVLVESNRCPEWNRPACAAHLWPLSTDLNDG